MVGVDRVFWIISGPKPLLRQGHLEPLAHDCGPDMNMSSKTQTVLVYLAYMVKFW